MKNHSVENVFPVGNGPDVLAFDRGLQLLYVACESGAVSLFRHSSGKLEKVGNVNVGPNSHSSVSRFRNAPRLLSVKERERIAHLADHDAWRC